ncbi:MAG: hypothetical protein NT097_05520 [Actinobacteria bacterium]|nr:hypothetical protein [Actinomycetota bacterium]
MGWFKQAPAMPPELAQAISSHGRLLDWASHSDGLIAITKNSLVDISGDVTTVTPWTDSLQAKWEPPQLTVIFQGQSDAKPSAQSWTLDAESQLPRAVRDRVTSAVVVDRVFELPNAGKVRFVARKDENRTYWSAISDDLAASQSDIGQEEIAKALVELRSSFGI